MTLSIDIARAADIPALCDLLENLFAQEADFQPDRAKQATALAAIINDPAVGTILVARQDADEQVVGMVSLLWTISTAEGGRVALLEDMVVAPAARGGGIGSALLGAAIEHAEGTGATRVLEKILDMGVKLALDDFGTGYSSLGYLSRTRFSTIKVDRSFVQGASKGKGEAIAIIRAVVALAQSLGMATTAEGVETEQEHRMVQELGCSKVQGYYFGRPLPVEDARIVAGRAAGEARAA